MDSARKRTITLWTESVATWGLLREERCLPEQGLAVRFQQRQLWGLHRRSFLWTLSRNFAYRVLPTRRNTGAIPAASSHLRRSLEPINGTARHTTIFETMSSMPQIISLTTFIRWTP